MALQMSEEQQKEMLAAQDQANLMKSLMESPGTTPASLGMAGARSSQEPMQAGAGNDNKRGVREEDQEPERRQGKGSKLPRNEAKGSWNNRRSGGGWGNKWWTEEEKKSADKDEAETVTELCQAMAQLLLRHEDQHNVSRTESGFILFCQTQGMLSMVSEMHKTTEVWQTTKTNSPEKLTLSLRATLLNRFMTVWHQRLESCIATEEARKQAQELLIINEDGTVPYLQYNRTAMKLEIKTDRDPIQMEEVLRIVKEVGDLALLPLTVLRFHPLRKLVEQYKGDVLPMTLQLGLRTPEADRCWASCSRLAHSGACRAVAMTMRGEKMNRSGLAVHIQEMLNARFACCVLIIPLISAIAMQHALHCCGCACPCYQGQQVSHC